MYNQLNLEELETDYVQSNNLFWFELLCMWVIVITGIYAKKWFKIERKDL